MKHIYLQLVLMASLGLLFHSSLAQHTNDSLVIKDYLIDLNHPSNQVISELPHEMIISAYYDVLWSNYEKSDSSYSYTKMTKDRFFEKLGIKAGIDSIQNQDYSGERTVDERVEAYIRKEVTITRIRIMIVEKYDDEGNLIISNSDNDWYENRESRIEFITLLDEHGNNIASFLYYVLRSNLILDNPKFLYFDDKGEEQTYVRLFEESLFVPSSE